MTISIDFGTSNTVVARWNPATKAAETLTLPGLSMQLVDNPAVVPSLVYVEEAIAGDVTVGQGVRDRGLDGLKDSRFFRSFKRGIGSDIQGFLPELDGQTVNFERVGEWFLGAIAEQVKAAGFLEGEASELVLTVPVDSFEVYRNWLSGAIANSALGNIERVRLLDEPTAAALGYGTGDRKLLLVVDFGGGTLDLSLVKVDADAAQGQSKPLGFLLKWGKAGVNQEAQQPKTARVLAKAGMNLGGTDIDNWLVDFFQEKQGLESSPLTLRLVERLKLKLSQMEAASEVYFDEETLDSVELALDRSQFDQILRDRDFFDQLNGLMEQVLQQARRQGIEARDIEGALLVGGTSQIPAVQNWLLEYFPAEKILKDKPFEAIAHGALQLAQGITVKDFLYHGYGVRYWNRRENRHDWHPIIPKGQPYPMGEPVDLTLGASTPNQPSIELIIGELGEETGGGMEVFFEGDRLITKQTGGKAAVKSLNDRDGARSLAKLDPPGSPGMDRVRVSFRVDEQRQLRVSVDDLLANARLLDEVALVQLS